MIEVIKNIFMEFAECVIVGATYLLLFILIISPILIMIFVNLIVGLILLVIEICYWIGYVALG